MDTLLDRIEGEPKSRRWKLRAKIGERKRWYSYPRRSRAALTTAGGRPRRA